LVIKGRTYVLKCSRDNITENVRRTCPQGDRDFIRRNLKEELISEKLYTYMCRAEQV
jgi:hypothetical protein